MDRKNFNKKVIISLMVGLLLLLGCEEKEWPTDPHDLTRPEVISTNPEDGSIMIPVNQPIAVNFGKKMDLASLSALTTVKDASDNDVAGSWSGSDSIYTFKPTGDLSKTTLYQITMKGAFTPEGEWLGPGVRDANGNSIENETSFSFSTEGNYGNSPLFLGTGGSNPGIMAFVHNLELSEFDGYPGEGVQTPAITPDGSKVYVASSDNAKVIVIDVASNSISAEISMPDTVEGPRTLAVSPNGAEVWVACNGSMHVVVINTSTNQVEASISLADYAEDVHSMVINNAGTRGYITTNWDAGVIVLDIANREVIDYLEGVATVESAVSIAVSPDDSKIIVFLAWAEEEIAIIDATTNEVNYMSIGSEGDGWKIDVEGDFIYASGRWNGNIYKIDMKDMSYVQNNVENDLTGIALDTDGEVIYAISPGARDGEGAILILNSSNLSLLGSIAAGNYRGIVTP